MVFKKCTARLAHRSYLGRICQRGRRLYYVVIASLIKKKKRLKEFTGFIFYSLN